MAKELSAVARLKFIVDSAAQAENLFTKIQEGEIVTAKEADNMARSMRKAGAFATTLRAQLSALAQAAKASGASALDGAAGWDKMRLSIESVQTATRKAAQEQYLQKFGQNGFPANTPISAMTKDQQKAYTAAVDAQTISSYAKAKQGLNDVATAGPRTRYALYDVASTATVTAVALGAIGAYSIKASTDFDRSFADVRRTMDTVSDGSAAKLKAQLIDLTRTIPLTFTEIGKIATLGNQLGVSQAGLVSFTETIAKFSAVSGIAPEESAKAFGTLGTILGFTDKQYSNFASSVELVGRTSAATDADILSMTKDIGQQAHQAGFSADQVVALSGAMAQLRIAPERARGALTTYFGTLNKAVADGGKSLQEFSLITGIAADKLSTMVKNGQGVQVFQAFLKGLSNQGNIVNVTKALDDLGLKQLRVSDAFERLSTNQQVFTRYMGLAKQGYVENTELNRQYAIILDTVASKWQLFLNALKEFGAQVGSKLGPEIANVLVYLTALLHTLDDFAKTPFGGAVIELVTIIGGLVAGFTTVVGVGALAAASFLAIRDALVGLGLIAPATAAGLDLTSGALVGTGIAAEGASVGLRLFRAALVTTGVGALIVALGYLILLLTDFGGAMAEIQGPGNFFIDLINDSAIAVDGLISSVLHAASIVSQFIGNLPGAGVFKDWANGLTDLANQYTDTGNAIYASGQQAHQTWNQWVADQQKVQDSTDPTIGATNQYGTSVDALNKKLYDNLNASNTAVGGTKKVGDTASSTAAQVRTLVDYSNDLQSVMKRAFDIRFGPQQGLDAIATGWNNIRKSVNDAKKAIADAQAQIRSLTADKATKEYQLKIAVLYGDTTQATTLQAGISDLNNQIADQQKTISDNKAKANGSLAGNSDAAIANRNAILGLVGSYEDYIAKLAASGLSQDALKGKIGQLKQQFIQQATQLGFSRGEVEKYTGAFGDMSKAISLVPRNITVTANANPALQAISELKAKMAQVGKGVKVPITTTVSGDSLAKFARGQAIVARISSLQAGMLSSASTDSQISHNQDLQAQIDKLTRQINTGSYMSGGYTGNYATNQIAGAVHGQEFVFDATSTRNAGVNTLAFLQDLFRGGKSLSMGGFGGNGGYMELGPRSIDLLARRIADYAPNLNITTGQISSAARFANAASNAQGRS